MWSEGFCEAESILLARELDADLLLANERDGRRAAKNAGVKVKETIGVISDCIKRRVLTVGVVGSILSIESPTRFWIMRTRRERMALLGMGDGFILTVLCGGGSYFYRESAKIFS